MVNSIRGYLNVVSVELSDRLGQKIVTSQNREMAATFAQRGVPASMRPNIWRIILGIQEDNEVSLALL